MYNEVLLDTAPCGFISFQADKQIVYVNKTICDWLGYSGELVGRSIEEVFTYPTRIFFNTHFFPLLKLQDYVNEIFMQLSHKNKTSIPVLVNAKKRNGNDPIIYDCVFITVYERKKYEDEILNAKRVAQDALTSNSELIKLKESIEAHARELERKVQYQVGIHDNLVQFNKIISHDLQEPLRKIQVFADLISKDADTKFTNKSQTALFRIMAAADRLRMLTSGLQEFVSVDDDKVLSAVDLNTVVENAKAKASEARRYSNFIFNSDKLPVIEGYLKQLELMFFHLFDNSLQFRDTLRQLKIDISAVVLHENVYRIYKERYKFTEHVKVEYSDNGIGFDNEYKKYVFGMLQKMEPATSGLGIGLALVKRVVENHSGLIETSSVKNHGTKHIIILPLRLST